MKRFSKILYLKNETRYWESVLVQQLLFLDEDGSSSSAAVAADISDDSDTDWDLEGPVGIQEVMCDSTKCHFRDIKNLLPCQEARASLKRFRDVCDS